MLKMSYDELPEGITLWLEGRLIGPWVEELRALCEGLLIRGRPLTLDLADLAFVGTDGTKLLRSLSTRGVGLSNCSAFVIEQLRG